MTQREKNLFRTSCLLAAMVALGACSTAPRQTDDSLFGSITDAGARTWDKTMYLLGFDDEARAKAQARRASPGSDPRLLDEVDLAMLEEDARLPGDEDEVVTAKATDVVDSPAWSAIATGDDERSDEAMIVDEVLSDNAIEESPDNALDGEQTSDRVLVSSPDMTHVVGTSETLWDIAKATTGDATNWHVLADVNDLGPDAAVYPGQTLTIPADMLRPELASATDETADETSSTVAADERLTIPADESPDAGAAVTLVADASDSPEPAAALPTDAGTVFKLEPGETLWDFAKRTTGDALNWQAIASANGMSEDQATRVRPGQSFTVPESLLRESLADGGASGGTLSITDPSAGPSAGPSADPSTDAAATDALTEMVSAGTDVTTGAGGATVEDTRQALELVPIADAIEVDLPESTTAVDSEALLAESRDSVAGADGQALDDVDATYQPDAEDAVAEASALSDTPAEIMVSGTYYPKAVYNDADFSSSLLMRVSPGTTLQVSRAIGPWFEVQTAEGTGFVHHRDIK